MTKLPKISFAVYGQDGGRCRFGDVDVIMDSSSGRASCMVDIVDGHLRSYGDDGSEFYMQYDKVHRQNITFPVNYDGQEVWELVDETEWPGVVQFRIAVDRRNGEREFQADDFIRHDEDGWWIKDHGDEKGWGPFDEVREDDSSKDADKIWFCALARFPQPEKKEDE